MRRTHGAWETLAAQAVALAGEDIHWLGALANVSALIMATLEDVSWAGFYLKASLFGAGGDDELVLGPFQGGVACTRIGAGRGVCGTSFARDEVLVVEDVTRHAGHIACDAESRSELVVPLHAPDGSCVGVIDLDSHSPARFDDHDARGLADLSEALSRTCALRTLSVTSGHQARACGG